MLNVVDANNHSNFTRILHLEGIMDSCLITSPLFNCQICSFAGYAYLSPYKRERLEKLKAIHAQGGKPLMLIDIQRKFEEGVEDIFTEEYVVFKQQYTSTNESSMTMYLVKTIILNQ